MSTCELTHPQLGRDDVPVDVPNPKNEYPFYCDACGYRCQYKSGWKAHIATRKHARMTGGLQTPNVSPNSTPPSTPPKEGSPIPIGEPSPNQSVVEPTPLNFAPDRPAAATLRVGRPEEKEYGCQACGFKTINESLFVIHESSINHKRATKTVYIDPKNFICGGCNYSTPWKSHWSKHISTKKHLKKANLGEIRLGQRAPTD